MSSTIDADYLVVGAGAAAMAFVDALVDHCDAHVVVVDRRHSPGGHWLAAYPFVRLHQSSAFYGVASTLLGGGRLQQSGPEQGLQERASQPEIVAYYAQVMERMVQAGRVEFFPNSEVVGERTVVSHVSGRAFRLPESCRVVDARYLAPAIAPEMAAPFDIGEGARVVTSNDLAVLQDAPSRYVVLGSGKTSTDSCIWLLQRGVDPDAICWVRPREPWMFNRAHVQPDPAIFLGMAADVMQAAAESESLDGIFLRLEEGDVMMRIDRSVTPTMAKAPTLATWELAELRTIEDVVRRGRVRRVERGRLDFDDGPLHVGDDTVVVHCAADGLKNPPLVPVWSPERITVQPIRAGFPCFGAALVGYVEATRTDDAEKNALCVPSSFGNSLADWARMNLLGTRSAMRFSAEPDVKAWIDTVALNPARVPAGHPGSPALDAARERLAAHTGPALERLAELSAG